MWWTVANKSVRSVDSNCNTFSTWWEILQGFIHYDLLRLLIPKFFPAVSPPKCLCSTSKLYILLCFSLPISKILILFSRFSNPLGVFYSLNQMPSCKNILELTFFKLAAFAYCSRWVKFCKMKFVKLNRFVITDSVETKPFVFFAVADDDSGTDENCDSPLLSPPTPPSSGFAMAKKMTVGVVSDESGDASKGGDPVTDSDEKLVFSLGLLLSCQLPTAATLTELRQRKKVRC